MVSLELSNITFTIKIEAKKTQRKTAKGLSSLDLPVILLLCKFKQRHSERCYT